MTRELQGRVAIVTGVSRRQGIGFAIARRLASMGAGLFLQSYAPYDRLKPWGANEQNGDGMVSELKATGVRVESIELELSEPGSPAKLVTSATEMHDHADILVINHAYDVAESLDELSIEQIDMHLAINVSAPLLLAKEFARRHDCRQRGRIVKMTSGQHLGPMPS